jgi:hypothetical protein
VAAIAVDGATPLDYVHGGAAAARAWVRATADNLGVQPVSPVFLYARSELDLNGLSAHFCAELAALQHRFETIVGLRVEQAPALVMRISHEAGSVVRSERRPLASIVAD